MPRSPFRNIECQQSIRTMLKRSKFDHSNEDQQEDESYEECQVERQLEKTEAVKDLLRHRGSYIVPTEIFLTIS